MDPRPFPPRPGRPRSRHERAHRGPAPRRGPDLRADLPRRAGGVVAPLRRRCEPGRAVRTRERAGVGHGPATAGWHNLWDATVRQDALWFLRIASEGYVSHDGSAAFFPLYPFAIRMVAWLPGDQPHRRSPVDRERLVPRRTDRAARAHPARVRRRGRRRMARRTVCASRSSRPRSSSWRPTRNRCSCCSRSRRSGVRAAIGGRGRRSAALAAALTRASGRVRGGRAPDGGGATSGARGGRRVPRLGPRSRPGAARSCTSWWNGSRASDAWAPLDVAGRTGAATLTSPLATLGRTRSATRNELGRYWLTRLLLIVGRGARLVDRGAAIRRLRPAYLPTR